MPDISVVMGVYNGGPRLPETIESILSQKDVNFEFIIVNDGSTDQTREILKGYGSGDSRLRIIHQENKGLTKSLITGCSAAKARYVARQDAGDLSLPGRLLKELDVLRSTPDAAVVCCGTRFIGPKNEPLYEVIPDTSDLTPRLLTLDLDKITGPSMHGCTMFRKDKYEQVRGYRSSFYFAQDLDLWVRFAEIGRHIAIPDVLYQASVSINSISSRYRKRQVEATRLILQSARLRRKGLIDDHVLKRAISIKGKNSPELGRIERARALYFIGACLRRSRNSQAHEYFERAFLTYPFHLKSAYRFFIG